MCQLLENKSQQGSIQPQPSLTTLDLTQPQDDPSFARTQLIKDPKRRLRAIWDMSKTKMMCEGGDEFEEENIMENFGGLSEKSRHGGCGSVQPSIRREGLKFLAVFKGAAQEVCCCEDLDEGH